MYQPTTGNVHVELSQTATRFSVSVSTVLPVDVDKDGKVTTASDNRIVNHSFGPVKVKDITVEPLSDWQLYDFSKEKVGHSFSFQVNGNDISAADGRVKEINAFCKISCSIKQKYFISLKRLTETLDISTI